MSPLSSMLAFLQNEYIFMWSHILFIIIKIFCELTLMLFCFVSTTGQICTVFPPIACTMVLAVQDASQEDFPAHC